MYETFYLIRGTQGLLSETSFLRFAIFGYASKMLPFY